MNKIIIIIIISSLQGSRGRSREILMEQRPFLFANVPANKDPREDLKLTTEDASV